MQYRRVAKPDPTLLVTTAGEPSTVHPAQHEDQMATDWSQDGRFLLYVRADWTAEPRKRSTDLWRYEVSTRTDAAVVSTPADEEEAAISPDGRWLAYTSNETDRLQVFVRPFAGATPRWQLSTDGGNMPQRLEPPTKTAKTMRQVEA